MATNTDSQTIVISLGLKAVALIILVFVGGLVSGIVIYQRLNSGTNQATSEETLELSNQHVWLDNTWSYLTEAAIVIVNSGDRDVTIRKVTVREIECNWNDMYFWESQMGPTSSNLQHPSTELTGAAFSMAIDGVQRTFQQANSVLTLASHWTAVLFMKNVGNITLTDIPDVVTIAVFTDNTFFYKETEVEAQFTFMATEQVQITNIGFGPSAAGSWIAVTVNNTGTSSVTINEAWVNNVKQTTTLPSLPQSIAANKGTLLYINMTIANGYNYQVKLVSSRGNQFTYSAVAPTT